MFLTELPGPPTNLAISNIGPRSVSLQFKPGYDGKTSISRWLVEAQVWQFMFNILRTTHSLIGSFSVSFICLTAYAGSCPCAFQIGIIGENEEWLMVQELANEPDARSLEVFDLNPYTFYRCTHAYQQTIVLM